MDTFLALLFSFLFVFLIIGLSEVLSKLNILNDEGARKFIHIGVGHWVLIARLVFVDSIVWYALIPPFTFIILNYLSYRFDLVKSMERNEKSSSDMGTVYYSISLFIVVLLDIVLNQSLNAGLFVVPILVMAWGDGLSAIIGKRFGQTKLVNNKTVAGTITMFIVAATVVAYFMDYDVTIVLVISIVATLFELITPRGLDNLSVPLSVYGILYLLTI
jgi:phytol kinase